MKQILEFLIVLRAFLKKSEYSETGNGKQKVKKFFLFRNFWGVATFNQNTETQRSFIKNILYKVCKHVYEVTSLERKKKNFREWSLEVKHKIVHFNTLFEQSAKIAPENNNTFCMFQKEKTLLLDQNRSKFT